MNVRGRIAALLEVLGVYVAGQFLITLLIPVLGLKITNPLQNITTAEISDAELLAATRHFFLLLVAQYAGWFLLIIPINWWHRRRGFAAYGLTRAGRSWQTLLLAGVGAAALVGWPAVGVNLVDTVYDLGPTVPWRQALFDTSWRRWEFWLFMAVASYAFIPFVEEWFYRGYVQRRLAEDWGDGPAIVGTSLLFVFAHGQYLMLNAYNISLIVGLLMLAVGFGVVFAWTRSLIPVMVGHAIINMPMTPFWQCVILAASLVGAVIVARRAAVVVKDVFSRASVMACVVLGIAGIAWAIVSQRIDAVKYLAVIMVVVAVGLHVIERRRLLTCARRDMLAS